MGVVKTCLVQVLLKSVTVYQAASDAWAEGAKSVKYYFPATRELRKRKVGERVDEEDKIQMVSKVN